MNTSPPKVTIHMASSLDFFIAKKDGGVSWMETSDSYEKGVDGVTAEGAEEFLRSCGTRYERNRKCTSKRGCPLVLGHRLPTSSSRLVLVVDLMFARHRSRQ
jgi:hypothetical protein